MPVITFCTSYSIILISESVSHSPTLSGYLLSIQSAVKGKPNLKDDKLNIISFLLHTESVMQTKHILSVLISVAVDCFNL